MSYKNLRLQTTEDQPQILHESCSSRKIRQVYIVPTKDLKPQPHKQTNPYLNPSSYKMYQTEFHKNPQSLPPRSTLFKRNRNRSRDQNNKDQSQYQYHNKRVEATIEVSANSRSIVMSLQRKLQQQTTQKQELIQKNISNELKITNLQHEIMKLRYQKKQLQKQMMDVQRQFQNNKNHLIKAYEEIQQLKRHVKQHKINLKSLTNLKNIQSQLEYLQERNRKLSAENQSLQKVARKKKVQGNKQSTSESQGNHQNGKEDNKQKIKQDNRNAQRNHGKEQVDKRHYSREKLLELNLFELQKKLYEKQNEINKLKIQLNCIDRKRTQSIDQVKHRKDQEIKNLRQKFIKISQDLKEAKEKMEKNERGERKKSGKEKHMFLKKVSSSRNIGLTSQSQEVTFELSSQV